LAAPADLWSNYVPCPTPSHPSSSFPLSPNLSSPYTPSASYNSFLRYPDSLVYFQYFLPTPAHEIPPLTATEERYNQLPTHPRSALPLDHAPYGAPVLSWLTVTFFLRLHSILLLSCQPICPVSFSPPCTIPPPGPLPPSLTGYLPVKCSSNPKTSFPAWVMMPFLRFYLTSSSALLVGAANAQHTIFLLYICFISSRRLQFRISLWFCYKLSKEFLRLVG